MLLVSSCTRQAFAKEDLVFSFIFEHWMWNMVMVSCKARLRDFLGVWLKGLHACETKRGVANL